MPNSLVKTPEDERLWQKAKGIAADSGHSENYAYIMGIYKKMNPDRFDKSAARVAERFLQAASAEPREPGSWQPGQIGPFNPTKGEGSQTPPTRDNQGKAQPLPEFGAMAIPGYEWHDKSKDFHRMAANEKLGVDVRSFDDRVRGWWDDLTLLIQTYWDLQKIEVKRTRTGLTFKVQQFGPLNVEVVGTPKAPEVFISGKGSKKFDSKTSLWDILMWIDQRSRGGGVFASEHTAATITLGDVADEIERANGVLNDATDMLSVSLRGGPALVDTYKVAAEVARELRSTGRDLDVLAAKLAATRSPR